MDNSALIQLLNNDLAIQLPEKISFEELKEQISQQVNQLIESEFQNLISLLYRLDINEAKLRSHLKENPGEDSGKIIAELIIERQLQKIKSRKENKRDNNITEEDKW